MPYNYGQMGPNQGNQMNQNGFQQNNRFMNQQDPNNFQNNQFMNPQNPNNFQQPQPIFQPQFPQMPQMNAPQQFAQESPQQKLTDSFSYVSDIVEAKLWQLRPGESAILKDSNQPFEYRKARDPSGKYLPFEIYMLTKVDENTMQPMANNFLQQQPVNPIQNEPISQPQIDLSEFLKKCDLESVIAPIIDKKIEEAVDRALAR